MRNWVKTLAATLFYRSFSNFPTVAEAARDAFSESSIDGYSICAWERPPLMTGLLFSSRDGHLPGGLPVRTPRISER